MFQVGFSLMNLTAILLPQDRCSMLAECFTDEHCFSKKDLSLASFCYVYIPPHYLFDLSVNCWHHAVSRFIQRQGSSFVLELSCIWPCSISQRRWGEEERLKLLSSWQIRTRNVVNQLTSIEQCVLNTLVHHDLVQPWLDQGTSLSDGSHVQIREM